MSARAVVFYFRGRTPSGGGRYDVGGSALRVELVALGSEDDPEVDHQLRTTLPHPSNPRERREVEVLPERFESPIAALQAWCAKYGYDEAFIDSARGQIRVQILGEA